jgi:hypothetical protein
VPPDHGHQAIQSEEPTTGCQGGIPSPRESAPPLGASPIWFDPKEIVWGANPLADVLSDLAASPQQFNVRFFRRMSISAGGLFRLRLVNSMVREQRNSALTQIKVDPEFATLIPPLSESELALLEESLRREGLREPLLVWKETYILLDGHNRLRLCQKLGIEPRLSFQSLPDREAARLFLLRIQMARRNLSRGAEAYLRGRRYLDSRHQGARSTSGHNDPKRLSEELAQEFKVGEKTIRRDANFALAVDAIVANCGEEAKQQILSRGSRLLRNRVIRLSKMKPREQQAFFDELIKTGKPPQHRTTKKRATIALPTEPRALVETLRREFSSADLDKILRLLRQFLRKGQTPS